jgi:hypothetical protein
MDGEVGTENLVFGKQSVRAGFATRPHAIRRVVIREGALRYLQEFVDLAHRGAIELEVLPAGRFSAGQTHRGTRGIFIVIGPSEILGEAGLDSLQGTSVASVGPGLERAKFWHYAFGMQHFSTWMQFSG